MRVRMAAAALLVLVAGFLSVPAGAQSAKKTMGQPKIGETFRDCRNCPEMVVLPAGSFVMGSPATETGRRENERQHKVTIPKPFAVSKTEVTWDQWESCVRARFCDGPAVDAALKLKNDGTPNPEYVDFGRGTRPVVGVSWYDAQMYVGYLNDKTGSDDAYRLLSDAEWEYAARAGSATAFPWGDAIDHNHGNFGIPGPGLGGKAEGRDTWMAETAPVGSFPPTPSACTTCTATRSSGWTTATRRTGRTRAPTGPRRRPATASRGCSGLDPSSATRTCSDPRSARRPTLWAHVAATT